jgi:hypothetical protein
VAHRPLSRKSFLAKGAQLFGGAVVGKDLLGGIHLDKLPRTNIRRAARASGSAGSGLARLRAAYESKDLDQLLALLHPRVEWRGIKRRPWSRAPA